MKSFIYLDTDTLNSYIAQIDDGLKTLQTSTKQLSNEREKKKASTIDGEGEADFTLFGKGLDAKIEYIYNHLYSTSNAKLYSDVETKVLHDNVFRQVMEHFEKNGVFESDNLKIGDFINIIGEIRLLDLGYYKSLFNEKDFVNLINEPEKEMVNAEFNKMLSEVDGGLNRQGKRSPEYKKKKNEVETKKREVINAIDRSTAELGKQLEVLLKLFPYTKLLSVNNYLAVFDEKYLRDDIQKAPFKYGGNVHLVGYITNTTHVDKENTFFSGPMNMINGILASLFDFQDEMYIVHPIAIYYENK